MNEDVKSENLRIHSRADELIACLEGEIAKRDEELAACRIAVENCEVFRARIAELEARNVWLECEAQVNAAPVSEAKAQGVVMPEHETSTPSSKWASAGEPDPHGKTYDCERAELSMGEYTDDELANAVFMHDHRSFDIAATMRGEPGSIVLLTAAKERIRWLSRSLYKALACLNATHVQQVSVPVACSCGREYPANSYSAGFISGSGMCEVCDAAMPPKDIPQHASVPDGWEASLNLALVLETERAIKQRDEFLKTGISTAALGGSHDTCFAAIVRRHIAMIAAAPAAPAAGAGGER